MDWQTLTFPSREQTNTDLDSLYADLVALPQLAPYLDELGNGQSSVRLGFSTVGSLEVSIPTTVATTGIARTVTETPEPQMPWAWHGASDLATITAFVTNTSYFFYLGKAKATYTTINVLCRVETAGATITWAEVGICEGEVSPAATLTRRGVTDVAATFNTTGLKTTTVTVADVTVGDNLWVAFGSQATTPYQLRAGLADDLQTGAAQQTAARISTLTIPVIAGVSGATLAIPMVRTNPT